LSRRFRPSNSYQEIPSSHAPSADDVRAEAIDFEKQVKDYIARQSGKVPTGQLVQLIHDVLPRYPKHPNIISFWDRFLIEAKELKELRNSIVHSDIANLPSLPELYQRFKDANTILNPFEVCSVPRERFTQFAWVKDRLQFHIDDLPFSLTEQDVENFLIELHPAMRGTAHFSAGKKIHSRMLKTSNESRTYYVEGSEPFKLNDHEAMALEDLLMCFLGNPALRRP
jgi:hypothetical protein